MSFEHEMSLLYNIKTHKMRYIVFGFFLTFYVMRTHRERESERDRENRIATHHMETYDDAAIAVVVVIIIQVFECGECCTI